MASYSFRHFQTWSKPYNILTIDSKEVDIIKSIFRSRDILAKNVFNLRKKVNNWSQEELAYRAKLSSTYVSDIENAKSNVGIDYIDNLAFAFGISTTELLTNHSHPTNRKQHSSKY